MLKRQAILLGTFLAIFTAQAANAFWDPPSITPATPQAGQTISVVLRGGICDGIFVTPGYPQITQVGSTIRVVFSGVHETNTDFCNYPIGTLTYPIGTLVQGSYTLQVDLDYSRFPGGPATLPVGSISFDVVGQPVPVAAPMLQPIGVMVLVMLLGATAAFGLRKRRELLLLLMLLSIPLGARGEIVSDSHVVEIIVTGAPGSPTPSQIVSYYNAPPGLRGAPPLAAFDIKPPLTVQYLLPTRATGDFSIWLAANPHSARYMLEQIVLASYPSDFDLSAAISALRADPYVASANATLHKTFESASLMDFVIDQGSSGQYGRDALGIDAAWSRAAGYALVGVIDTGLSVSHPALHQFDAVATPTYVGGNFMPVASLDISRTGQPPPNDDIPSADEENPVTLPKGSPCSEDGGSVAPDLVGHGTHVSGLISANGASGQQVQGTCKHCGIAMWKTDRPECFAATEQVLLRPNDAAKDRGIVLAADAGVQVINMSFGGLPADYGLAYCGSQASSAVCLALTHAKARGTAMVAASGNDRGDLNFPASDPRVVSAGGFNQSLQLWDFTPNCPLSGDTECGSNYSKNFAVNGYNHQELLASAPAVLSTTYSHKNWSPLSQCGDGFPAEWGDGVGLCTGTSMSSPQISGIVGILRSVNPLAPTGVPEPATNVPAGLRTVLAQTASRGSLGWEKHLGYGIPDAAAAVRKTLGSVFGATVRNRATPLFRLFESTTKDFAETTSPQFALSLMINQAHNYTQPANSPDLGAQPEVPGYAFPTDSPEEGKLTFESPPAVPRANIYVLTTEYRPRDVWPVLVPLHLMSKTVASGTDFMLVTNTAEIEGAKAQQYELRTIQGYVYTPCSPADCIPPGATILWREYNTANSDCAVFIDSEKNAFEMAHYTALCPGTTTRKIGYAYAAGDEDQDGLPNAFEYVVGTNPHAGGANSDGDTKSDAAEFPMVGIPVSDPRLGPDTIFKYGFDYLW